ncbi:hypothetical protein P3W45_001494 [Vairimorpha bombi]
MHIVITGASGSGKTSIINHLTDKLNIPLSVSYTTRDMRPGEVDGKDYHFITKDKFNFMIENDELVEYTAFNNNYYGTGKISSGRMIFDLEYEGVLHFKNTNQDFLYIFIDVEKSKLKARLSNRGTTGVELDNRMMIYDNFEKLKSIISFDLYVDNNGSLESSIGQLLNF